MNEQPCTRLTICLDDVPLCLVATKANGEVRAEYMLRWHLGLLEVKQKDDDDEMAVA